MLARHGVADMNGFRQPERIAQAFWLTCAVGSLIFSAWLGPGLLFAKLQSDASVYLLQARNLWQHGSAWNFSVAEGLPTVVYTPVPAYLRAPLFALELQPATLVLLLQIQNLLVLALLAATSQRYLRLRLPAGTTPAWAAVPWLLIAVTYQPWVLNAFMPMGDHIFALLTLGSMIAFLEAEQQHHVTATRTLVLLGFTLAAIATIQKSTAAGLIMFALILFGRRGLPGVRPATVALGAATIVLTLLGFATLHVQTFATGAAYYFEGRTLAIVFGDTVVNLLIAALPGQIVPNFSYLLTRDFSSTHAVTMAAITLNNLPWFAAGLSITAALLTGAWSERRRLAPELAMLAVSMPVYALATNSTARYLASVQPVLWLLFLASVAPLAAKLRVWPRSAILGMSTAAALVTLLIATNLSRSFSSSTRATAADLPEFLHQLADTFVVGRSELAALLAREPGARIVLTNDDTRWSVLADARYISVGRASAEACRGTPVFAVFACDTRNCARQTQMRAAEINQLYEQHLQSGLVFAINNRAATFRIDRWSPAPGTCSDSEEPPR